MEDGDANMETNDATNETNDAKMDTSDPKPENSEAKIEKRSYCNCCVFDCLNTTLNKKTLSFFKLPVNEERRFEWLRLIGRNDLYEKPPSQYRVCEVHFEPELIMTTSKRKLLKQHTLPTRMLPEKRYKSKGCQTEHMAVQIQTQCVCVLKIDAHSQTPNYLSNNTPLIKGLKNEIKEYKKKLKAKATESEYKKFLGLCDKFLNKKFADIVKQQSKLKFHSPGNRFADDYKSFCLKLFSVSPKAYNLMEDILCLPGKTVIKSMLRPKTKKSVGVNTNNEPLKQQSKMSTGEESNKETNPGEMMPKENIVMPKDNLIMPKENPMMPSQNLIMPKENPMMPSQNLMMPKENPMMPRENLIMHKENPMMPRENSVMPRENPIMPRENTMMPRENTIMPRENTMMPRENPMMPRENPMMPRENPMMPRENPMMPRDNLIMPRENLMPQDNLMMPKDNLMMPKDNLMMPTHTHTQSNDILHTPLGHSSC